MKYTDKNNPISLEVGLHLLPEPYKTITTLRLIEKKSYKEIGKIINRTPEYIRVCLYRAKKKLFKLDKMLKHCDVNKNDYTDLLQKWVNINIC